MSDIPADVSHLSPDVIRVILKKLGRGAVQRSRLISPLWQSIVDEKPMKFARFFAEVKISMNEGVLQIDVTPKAKEAVGIFLCQTRTVQLIGDEFVCLDDQSSTVFRSLTERLPFEPAPQNGVPYSQMEKNLFTTLHRIFTTFKSQIFVIDVEAVEATKRVLLDLQPAEFGSQLLQLPFSANTAEEDHRAYQRSLEDILTYADGASMKVVFEADFDALNFYYRFQYELKMRHRCVELRI